MNAEILKSRLRELASEDLPLPGEGHTAERHRRLMQISREDVSLAKLAEAHFDAIAILAEAGRLPAKGAIYGVWASEQPGKSLELDRQDGSYRISGKKMFSSGIGFVDRALLTVGQPEQLLIELDLRSNEACMEADLSAWKVDAFRFTATGTVNFQNAHVSADSVLGEAGWYTSRPGFWHGACGPAACWAGGAAGLLDYAMRSSRQDPHTLAHLAAMHANIWATRCYLDTAGAEIDAAPADRRAAQSRALQVRHLVEQACTDTLQRFARAYGPAPLAMDSKISLRYLETDLYLRQSHAERDLESLARSFLVGQTP